MNKFCIAVTVAVALAATQWVAAAEDLLKNPGFESDLSHWHATGTAQRIVREDWHAQSSRWAFGIGNDNGPPNASGALWQDIVLPFALTTAKACTFSFYTMGEEHYSGTFKMKIEFRNAAGAAIETVQRAPSTGKGKWRLTQIKAVAPPATHSVRVTCSSERMSIGDGWSFIWLDNGSFTFK